MMSAAARSRSFPSLTDAWIDAVIERLRQDRIVRRTLPGRGRLHIDRQLPFLCLHRRPHADRPRRGTQAGPERLITAEAAYLLALDREELHGPLARLIRAVAALMIECFGGFLIVEVWEIGRARRAPASKPPPPRFRIHHGQSEALYSTLDDLGRQLQELRLGHRRARVEMVEDPAPAPPGLPPIMALPASDLPGCHLIGLEVAPAYRNPVSGETFPVIMRAFRRHLGHALDHAFFTFTRRNTIHLPPHFHSLGRRAMVRAVWEADRLLAEVSSSFDVVFQATPTNMARAWHDFRAGAGERAPEFHYRPLPIDPGQLKRRLFGAHVERVEDPTLQQLLLDKQFELDRKLTMMHDLGTPAFRHTSQALYGATPIDLLREARHLLDHVPVADRPGPGVKSLDAEAFVALARRELDWYRARYPGFKATVRIRARLFNGLMASRGRLLVGSEFRVPRRRAVALLQHEIGTHLVVYYNGRSQPFQMLHAGLPGYEETQEGLAVFAEYLAGGLSAMRLRVLAARVLAVEAMTGGAEFVDVYRLLHRDHRFAPRIAFTMTARVFRGGGLTKDAIYLRGLDRLLRHLAEGMDIDLLMVGRVAVEHVGMVRELLYRKILRPAPLRPRSRRGSHRARRLAVARAGCAIQDLLQANATDDREAGMDGGHETVF